MEPKSECQTAWNNFLETAKEMGIIIEEIDAINWTAYPLGAVRGVPEKELKRRHELEDKLEGMKPELKEKADTVVKCQCNKTESTCNFKPHYEEVAKWLGIVEDRKDRIEFYKHKIEEEQKKIFGKPERYREVLKEKERQLLEWEEVLKEYKQKLLDCECK